MTLKIKNDSPSNTRKKDKPYTSLQRKIWLSFLFIYTPVLLITYYVYYLYTFQASLDILTLNISQTVDGMLKSIDAENFKMLYQEESTNNPNCPPGEASSVNGYYPEDNPRFRVHMDWLQTVEDYHPNAYVYTYVKGPNPGDVIGIGSTGYFRRPQEGFKFCQLYNSNDQTRIYDGLFQRTDVWEIYQDSYGNWITSYAPIKDANGEIVGAVGVDVPADVIVQMEKDLLPMALLSFGMSFLIVIVIMLRFTDTVTIPIQNMVQILSEFGGHEPRMNFSEIKRRGIHRDEIDTLIEAMQSMVARINKQNLELTQSREQMQNLTRLTLQAQEEERRYVSRELHDQAGHLLINLRYTIEAILTDLKSPASPQASSAADHEAAVTRLSAALKQVDQSLDVIRALSHQMRTSLLDVGDINLALQESCIDFKRDKNISVAYEGVLPSNLSEEVAVSLYRFLQEALTNVLKHASATKVHVFMMAENGWVKLSVADNGRGVAADSGSDGIGILGMKERFLLLGGAVESKSSQDGFMITVRVPINGLDESDFS